MISPSAAIASLSPVQRRMLAVLADGEPHHKKELFDCLDDNLANPAAIKVHLSGIRKALKAHGHTVVCELVNLRAVRYRWVRLLNADASYATDGTG